MTRPMRSLRRQAGAAILLAMLIMTLVATLAAGMVWLQWRGIEVESSERARTQGEWLLNAALDWGDLILKSSIRNGHTDDDLGQPWATPLAETKLSAFLSADGSQTDDSGPEAYLSGQITDAQAKYNLYNLLVDPTKPDELERLKILCSAAGVSQDLATTISSGLGASWTAQQRSENDPSQKDSTNSTLMPIQVADLAWYGIDPVVLKQLEPFIELLPGSTTAKVPMNLNTAPAEVLMAAIPGINRSQAEQIVQRRQSKPFTNTGDIIALLGCTGKQNCPTPNTGPQGLFSVVSDYFVIFGQLRYEQHVIRERSVVHRASRTQVDILRRERLPPDAS